MLLPDWWALGTPRHWTKLVLMPCPRNHIWNVDGILAFHLEFGM